MGFQSRRLEAETQGVMVQLEGCWVPRIPLFGNRGNGKTKSDWGGGSKSREQGRFVRLSQLRVCVCLPSLMRRQGGRGVTRYQSEHLRVGRPGFCYQHGHLLSVQSWVSILFCPRLNEWNCKLIKVNVPLTGLRNVFKENFDQNALYRVTLCKDISKDIFTLCKDITRCFDLSCAA